MSQSLHLIYTRSLADWQRFITNYPQWQPFASHYPLLDTELMQLSRADYNFLSSAESVIFTSQYAVAALFSNPNITEFINSNAQCIAIGQRSAAALGAHIEHKRISTAPPPYNSEALLSVWQPKEQKIAIIAAPGGRSLLSDHLQVHNQVHIVMAYRRFCVNHPTPIPLHSSAENIILIASGHSLRCLMENTPQKILKLLQYRVTLACISQRVADLAKQNGFQHVFNAPIANEDMLIRAITTR